MKRPTAPEPDLIPYEDELLDDPVEPEGDRAPRAGAAPRLSGKQKHYLRGLGHHLEPIVLVGKEGVSDSLVEAAQVALVSHELIKVRVGDGGGDRHDVAADVAERTGSALVQLIGRVVLLYRPRPEEPTIRLPPR